MRTLIKVLSLFIGLAAAATLVYRTTHPTPAFVDISEQLKQCEQYPDGPGCPRPKPDPKPEPTFETR
jgi:hypothetical protein